MRLSVSIRLTGLGFFSLQTENYEQRIREQQEQLSFQQTLIDKLKSQLLLVDSSRGIFLSSFLPFLDVFLNFREKVNFEFFYFLCFVSSDAESIVVRLYVVII